MKRSLIYIFLLGLMCLSACRQEEPVITDGNAVLKLVVGWQTPEGKFEKLANAKVMLLSEYGQSIKFTDEQGSLDVRDLPSSSYSIAVRAKHPNDNNIILVGNKTDIEIRPGSQSADTIFTKAISSSGIAINEVYSCGPVTKDFYFFDQFIELYNSSDEVKYLDGMQVIRMSANGEAGKKGPGADEGDDNDIDGVTYIFKFPGKAGEKNFPFQPHTFKVLAATAMNHKTGHPNSIDLSKADWEFYNQFSANDIDNPGVQNLINIKQEHKTEFLLSLTSDIVVVTDGKDTNWEDGIDLTSIIDGIEFDQRATALHSIDKRVDRGYILSPSNYTGKSMQRKEPGVDTNDGTLDFEILNFPTPGYQK